MYYTVIDLQDEISDQQSLVDLNNQICKNIRRFSHFKDKNKIQEFVDTHFIQSKKFVMGKPISYYDVTHRGIIHFTEMLIKK